MDVFLRVNGHDVTAADALRHALVHEEGRRFVDTLVERELLRQHAESAGLAATMEEVQRAADEMRYERGLIAGARAVEWMRAHHQTSDSIAEEVEGMLLRNKAIAAIPDAEVERFYAANRDALEYVILFAVRLGTEADAHAALREIEGGQPFPAIAARLSIDIEVRRAGGFVGRLRRAEMSPDLARVIFEATPGQVVGPVRTERGYNLFMIAARAVPSIEEEAAGIRLLLFRELVERLRAAARVELPPLAEERGNDT